MMGFARALCTEQLFVHLALPASLKTSDRLNPLGRELIHDPAALSALIPHPFNHSDYPDRCLSFYVRGAHFGAWEMVERSDGPDRVEIRFEAGMDESSCAEVVHLLEGAIAVLRNEAVCSVAIIVHWEKIPQPRVPRPPLRLIAKLNTFCDDIDQLGGMLPEMEELMIQSVLTTVLLPEEIKSLEQHLAHAGWGELNPKARKLVKDVLARTRGARGADSGAEG